MLGKFSAKMAANLHILITVLTRSSKQKHNITLVFSSRLDCVSIECSCGRTFWNILTKE
jgi:hypothetical protein